MHAGKPIAVVAGVLLAVVRLANAGPAVSPGKPAVEPDRPPTDKFDFVKYIKEHGLNTLCSGESVVNDTICVTSMENNNYSPCLCTVIYNTTVQLDQASSPPDSSLSPFRVEIAMNKSIEFNDSAVYETWKNAGKLSPPVQLLMRLLNTISKWNSVCYNLNKVVTPYCKFLNTNVWLLTPDVLQIPKESPKQPNVDALNVKEPPVFSDKPEMKNEVILKEPNVSNNLLIVDGLSHDNESVVNDQKPKEEPDINDEEHTTELDSTKDTGDDELAQDVEENPQNQSETEAKDFESAITNTKIQSIYSQTTMSKKNGFSGTDDSHFLFYFSIMTILSMLFYLALYNKKKIIALLIEGRRGTNHRRRLNTATYSKVETDDGSTVF